MAELKATGVTVTKDQHTLIQNLDAALHPGELVAVIGPNGAGKTTALRCLAGLEHLSEGQVTLDNEAMATLPPALRARMLSYLPQRRPMAWPVRVRDVVALGRYSYGASPSHLSDTDRIAVDRALDHCALLPLADRTVDTLSGGEEARMHCAKALASETPLLLADEPVAGLDPFHQHQVLQLVRSYVDDGGGALVVLHDLSLVRGYADRLIAMRNGQIIAEGPCSQTLGTDLIQTLFNVRAQIIDESVTILGP